MARTVVGYIKQFLNSSANASQYGSTEPVTGLPISTGINVGAWQEFSDGEALQYSSKGVIAIQILTAGTGQTPGTYTVAASAGGASIQVVVAAGGTVTAVPTVLNAGGPYTDATIPTFTLTGAGGTAATFSATIGVLYGGTYGWVGLDPAVTGNVPVGTALYWLQTSLTRQIVTTVATGNNPDLAGWSIDPNFGAALPNAFIQFNGKVRALFDATPATAIGDVVSLTGVTVGTVTRTGAATAATTGLTVGYAVQVGTTLSPSLIRVTRGQSRF